MIKILKRLASVRAASFQLRNSSQDTRNSVLKNLAKSLWANQDQVLKANAKDLRSLPKATPAAFIDRLTLNESRLRLMAESLVQVSNLADPLLDREEQTLSNGLKLARVRAPLGVILMIFESRPNVATEAFGLAFKAGNAIILRGGRESMGTTKILYNLISQEIKRGGLSSDCLWGITDPDRKITNFLLKQKDFIDIVVPRGGDGLIKFVSENSAMPIIKNDRGLCHVYVHEDADLDMAAQIVFNSKCQRPGVCNAMETVLVNKNIARAFLEKLYPLMENVEWHADSSTQKILKGKKNIRAAKTKDWDTEYLDHIMNCKIVSSIDDALEHISRHGSRHSEAIVTQSEELARRFQNEVDAAAVYWNASTRFTDGLEFGLGGELGISTQKLHVRGPVGLKELTSFRWVIDGTGQIRK